MDVEKIVKLILEYGNILKTAKLISIENEEGWLIAEWEIVLHDTQKVLNYRNYIIGDEYHTFIEANISLENKSDSFFFIDYSVEDDYVDLTEDIVKTGIIKVKNERTNSTIVFDLVNKKAWIEGGEKNGNEKSN